MKGWAPLFTFRSRRMPVQALPDDRGRICIEWVKRVFMQESEIEIRQVFEAEDFGAEFTPELRGQEERQRAKIASRK